MGLGNLLGGRFGTLEKAMFILGDKKDDKGEWSFQQPQYVLINPSSIEIGAVTKTKKEEGVADEKTEETTAGDGRISPTGVTEEKVSMTLVFNIVEQYNAMVKDKEWGSLLTAATSLLGTLLSKEKEGISKEEEAEAALARLIKETDHNSVSLYNEEICCYFPLVKAAHAQAPAVFLWGNIQFAGVITNLHTTFNYFSSSGAPLGAEVDLTMIAGVDDTIAKESKTTDVLQTLLSGKGAALVRMLPGR